MHYVYLLRSKNNPTRRYIGQTNNLKSRLKNHNQGQSTHTKQFRPWNIETYIAFSQKKKAITFERYLKSGSGRAFANKHLWN